jgi:hypothetical protein
MFFDDFFKDLQINKKTYLLALPFTLQETTLFLNVNQMIYEQFFLIYMHKLCGK